MKKLFPLMALVLFLCACSGMTPAPYGKCIVSSTHGGPYVLSASSSSDVLVVDPLRTDDHGKQFPNDRTWEDIPCPF